MTIWGRLAGVPSGPPIVIGNGATGDSAAIGSGGAGGSIIGGTAMVGAAGGEIIGGEAGAGGGARGMAFSAVGATTDWPIRLEILELRLLELCGFNGNAVGGTGTGTGASTEEDLMLNKFIL